MRLPGRMIGDDGLVEIAFRKAILRSPHDVWHVADPRLLGVYLRSFRVLTDAGKEGQGAALDPLGPRAPDPNL